MSSTRIEKLVDNAQAAFDRRPAEVEPGLDVEDAALLQLRKACRLLAGAEALYDAAYYTLVIEASFVAIERTIEFRLLERGTMEPDDLPGTHPGVYREAAAVGIVVESMAADLADLWRDHRAKTYYQDGLASAERARAVRRAPARPEWSVASDAEGGSGERDGPGRTHLSSRPRRSVGHLQSWRTQKGRGRLGRPRPRKHRRYEAAAAVAGRRAAEGFRVSSPPKQTRIPSAASGDQVLDEPEAVHERHRVTVALTCKHGFGPSPAAISVV